MCYFHSYFSHLVAKLKAEATRIEMEAELTCQTKVSILLIIQSCYNLPPSLLLFLQMQEAEVQFLREQNELQVKRAKDLSNIEVRRNYNNNIFN